MADKQATAIPPNDFLAAHVDLAEAIRIKDRGVAKLRTIRQRMERQGCDMPALDLALRLQKLGQAEAEMRLRNALRYCRWMGMEMGAQSALFSDDADRPSTKAAEAFTEAQAYNEGYAAGLAGRNRSDHRFTAGSKLSQQFDTGWIDGQTELANQLGTERPENGTLKRPKKEAKAKAGTSTARGKPRGRGRSRRAAAHADA